MAGVAVKLVDYDTEQHQNYARGRALSDLQLRTWLSAFESVLPERRPLQGLDVGSGTGRFTSALAEVFGPVTGIEPSVRMREIALDRPQLPGVKYVAGSAEDLPAPSESADYALMFLSWHHVEDKPQAVRELTRVIRPGGRLLLRGNFSDHHPRPWWLGYFPGGYERDAAIFPPLHEVIEMFTSAGWHVTSFETVTEPSTATLGEMVERLHLRTFSFFSQITEEEAETWLRRLDELAARDPDSPAPVFAEPLLTLERPGSVPWPTSCSPSEPDGLYNACPCQR
jgi:ubiquinone/menaquinone biosynthesis C-methylase UbiE